MLRCIDYSTLRNSSINTELFIYFLGMICCFAELSTLPPHVIKSQLSPNLASARKDAARRCILFLKAMSSTTPCLNYSEWFSASPDNYLK